MADRPRSSSVDTEDSRGVSSRRRRLRGRLAAFVFCLVLALPASAQAESLAGEVFSSAPGTGAQITSADCNFLDQLDLLVHRFGDGDRSLHRHLHGNRDGDDRPRQPDLARRLRRPRHRLPCDLPDRRSGQGHRHGHERRDREPGPTGAVLQHRRLRRRGRCHPGPGLRERTGLLGDHSRRARSGLLVPQFNAYATQPPEGFYTQSLFHEYFAFPRPTTGPPDQLELSPSTATNIAGDEHCVTATVTDADGNPVPDTTVRFSVSGANTGSGNATTDSDGEAEFCYTGTKAGDDTISAYADTDGNERQGRG